MEKAPTPLPAGRMDDDIKTTLEKFRCRVPRILFRAWSNSHGKFSGSHKGLNTTKAITPLAFFKGCGRSSVYDLTKKEFSDMAFAHLNGLRTPLTELSSWTASLSFAMSGAGHARHPGAHISIIDTKDLWNQNQIFFVPDLDFLRPGEMRYDHEYLAHGVIRGLSYRALPLDTLITAGFNTVYTQPSMMTDWRQEQQVANSMSTIRQARKVGEQYGENFALPMTLALLCKVESRFDLHVTAMPKKQVIVDGIAGLGVPDDWITDDTVVKDIVSTRNWPDVEQLIKLMRAVAQAHEKEVKSDRVGRHSNEGVQANSNAAKKGLKRKLKSSDKTEKESELDIPKRRKKALRSETRRQPVHQHEEVAKRKLECELKKLVIDMKDPWVTDA